MNDLIERVRQLHKEKGFRENGGEDKLFRMSLIMEEVGEICSSITKGKGDFEEEHADLLILLLGNCVAYDIDVVPLTHRKLDKLAALRSTSVDGHARLVTSTAAEGEAARDNDRVTQ